MDGTRLAFRVEGTGPTVVLVSGHSGRAFTWEFQRSALAAAGFQVVTLDRRHTGESDFPAFGQRLSRQAADVHEFLGSLGRGAVLVGSSMGASVIYALVDTFGTAGLEAVCVIDQTPKMINDDEWGFGLRGLQWAGVPDFVQNFPGDLQPFHTLPPPKVMALLQANAGDPYPFAETRSLLLDHTVADWRDVLPRLTVPLLVAGGRHSPLWPVEHAEWCAQQAPDAQLHIFEQSGHTPHLAEPDRFNEVLIDFLRAR